MLYVIIGWDTLESRDRRPKARDAHLAHWGDWDRAGKIVLAGPMTDFAGSLFIVEADSQGEVEKKLAGDPYIKAGVYQRMEVHPFKKVFPSGSAQ